MEVKHTDAEGRLVLADAMSWVQSRHKEKVESLIELSTLTGACVVGLGEQAAGVFSNDDKLSADIKTAGEGVNERYWPLPITEEIRESMKGDHADLININGSRYGGAIEAAAFLVSC